MDEMVTAKVDVLVLRDGRTLKGIYGSRTGGPADRFYPFRGPTFTVAPGDIQSQTSIRYVSFPPFPAVLMLPFVALRGLLFNDVLFTALWAALNPAMIVGDSRTGYTATYHGPYAYLQDRKSVV